MPTIQPFNSGSIIRPMAVRSRTRTAPVTMLRTRRLKAIRAEAAPTAVPGTVVPAALAALALPTVQLNTAQLLPHIETWLAGPFGAPTLALGCALTAGIAAGVRCGQPGPRNQLKQFLITAGQAGIGSPLIFNALRAAIGSATTVNIVARGLLFGVATVMGTLAGRQAGKVAGARLPLPKPKQSKTYTAADWRAHRRARADAMARGSNAGGWAAGAIIGVATLLAK